MRVLSVTSLASLVLGTITQARLSQEFNCVGNAYIGSGYGFASCCDDIGATTTNQLCYEGVRATLATGTSWYQCDDSVGIVMCCSKYPPFDLSKGTKCAPRVNWATG